MRSKAGRVVLGAAVVVVAVALLVVLKNGGDEGSGGGSSGTAGQAGSGGGGNHGSAMRGVSGSQTGGMHGKPAVPTIVVKNGKPVGGVTELTYNEGERVRFKVESDVSDEVHLHGYEIKKDVEAGGSVSFDFPATIEGLFEAELEDRGEQILELRVNP